MKKKNYNIQAQKALEYIRNKRLNEEQERKNEFNKNVLENANRSFTTGGRKRKGVLDRIRKENEFYTTVFNESVINILSDVVEQSLLLDEDYAELNPEFKLDIKDVLDKVLNEGEIDTNVENEDMLGIFRAVHKHTPLFEEAQELDVKELTEEVSKKSKDDAESCIESLVKDTKDQVVEILAAEKKNAEAVNKDIEKTLEEDFKGFVTENKTQSLLEMFAINDAKVQIQESGDYNSELALANSVLMLTILEALDVSGIVDVNLDKRQEIKDLLNV